MHDAVHELLQWVRGHYFGKYRGVVTDNADPTQRGRLKVKVPAVLGSLELWAMPCVPYAGDQVGFHSLPATEAGVWVEFEAGDPSFPVWTGCFWADNELPSVASSAAIKVWKTEKLTIQMDDDNDELLIQTTSASKVTLATDVTIESGGASHSVGSTGVVSELGAGKVEVTAAMVAVNGGALEVI